MLIDQSVTHRSIILKRAIFPFHDETPRYVAKVGSAVMHIHDIQFVDFYYHQFSMNVHTSSGGKNSFLLRGIPCGS